MTLIFRLSLIFFLLKSMILWRLKKHIHHKVHGIRNLNEKSKQLPLERRRAYGTIRVLIRRMTECFIYCLWNMLPPYLNESLSRMETLWIYIYIKKFVIDYQYLPHQELCNYIYRQICIMNFCKLIYRQKFSPFTV